MLRAKNAYALDKVFASIVVIVLMSIITIYLIKLMEQRLYIYKEKEEN